LICLKCHREGGSGNFCLNCSAPLTEEGKRVVKMSEKNRRIDDVQPRLRKKGKR